MHLDVPHTNTKICCATFVLLRQKWNRPKTNTVDVLNMTKKQTNFLSCARWFLKLTVQIKPHTQIHVHTWTHTK